MPQNVCLVSVRGQGRLPQRGRFRRFSRGGIIPAWLIRVLPLVLAAAAAAEDLPLDFGWQNLEFRTYAPNSIREIADCKIEKIFLDHRKMGFFRVKLLPVLVVQGVQLELAGAGTTNEWAEGFKSDWLPDVKRDAVEWRDVSLAFKKEKEDASRLHASRAQPAASGGPAICSFNDVTLEAGGMKWRMAQAELRNENGRPFLVWQDGGSRRLDLFSGEISNNDNFNNSKFNGEKQ